MNNREKILNYMKARPGEHFTASEIAIVLGIAIEQARQALKDEGRCGRILAIGCLPHVEYVFTPPVEAKTHPGMFRERKLTRAEEMAIARCRELYPADMKHYSVVSNLPLIINKD